MSVIDVLGGLIEQRTPASAGQATSIHNLQVALDKLNAVVTEDSAPEVRDAVRMLADGFATLRQTAPVSGEPEPGQADIEALPEPMPPDAPSAEPAQDEGAEAKPTRKSTRRS